MRTVDCDGREVLYTILWVHGKHTVKPLISQANNVGSKELLRMLWSPCAQLRDIVA